MSERKRAVAAPRHRRHRHRAWLRFSVSKCCRASVADAEGGFLFPRTLRRHLHCLSIRLSLDGLGVTHVLAPEAELLGQLVHHVLEDDRVHVLAEQVEEEPVAHHGLLDDDVQALGLDPSKPARQRSTSMHVKTKINYIYGNDRLIRSIWH